MKEWCYICRTTVPSKYWPDVGTIIGVCAVNFSTVAQTILEWLDDGLTVERVPTAWIKDHIYTPEPYRPETPE